MSAWYFYDCLSLLLSVELFKVIFISFPDLIMHIVLISMIFCECLIFLWLAYHFYCQSSSFSNGYSFMVALTATCNSLKKKTIIIRIEVHFSLFHILHHFTLSCLNMRFMVFHLPHPLILSVYISSCCSTLPFFFSLSQHLTVSVFFFFQIISVLFAPIFFHFICK